MSSPLRPAESPGQKAWTKEESLAALRRLSEMLGGTRSIVCDVRGKLGRQAGCASIEAIRRLFGSWETALEKAGLAGLPTRKSPERDIALRSLREYFEHLLHDRTFLFYGEGADMVKKLRVLFPFKLVDKYWPRYARSKGYGCLACPPATT
ncbi:homing endonuclease associated repeat-containing protein [Thermanaeromonas toyohensis]|uniref:homing endonuclease associated repeat-containing protein n=1 Tax=Thermanaeromonas toyohensis TaxID=161154 RepID=UPI003BF5ACB0